MASTDPGPGPQPGDTFTASTVSGFAAGFPIVRASDLLGSLRTVDSIAERDAIATAYRDEGMIVHITGTNQNFQLQGGITNSDWVELTLSGGGGVTFDVTNGNAGAITLGQCVYFSAADTVDLGLAVDATSPSRAFMWVTDASIASSAVGQVGSAGPLTMRLEGGLTVNVNDFLFLSASTAGSLTNVAPVGASNIVQTLAVVKNTLSYDGATDFLVEALVVVGNRTQNAP